MESGLPSFPRDFSCPVVLRIRIGVSVGFAYGALTPCGGPFQALLLPS